MRIRLFSKKKKDNSVRNASLATAGALAANTVLAYSVLDNSKKPGKPGEKEIIQKMRGEVPVNMSGHSIPGSPGPAYSPSNNTVYMAGSHRADLAAHEMGHAHYFKNKKAGTLGKAAHKAYITGHLFPGVTGSVVGWQSGKKKAEREARGLKESGLGKYSAAGTALAMNAPVLAAEAAASLKGKKLLKNAGASKELQKRATRELSKAWGSYATKAAFDAGLAETTKAISYRHYKNKKDK